MERALTLVRAGRIDDAAAELERHLTERPDDWQARRLLAKIRFQRGEIAAGVALLTAALNAAGMVPELHFELGVMRLAQGRYQEAAEACRCELALRPDHQGARFNLAWAQRQLGETEAAARGFAAVAASNPGHADAWYNLGNIQLEGGQTDAAARSYHAALAAKPGHALARAQLGRVRELQGDLEGAIAAYRQALATDVTLTAVAVNLANLLTRSGRAAEALPIHQAVVAGCPDDPVAWTNLALTLRELDRIGESVGVLERGAARLPEAAVIWDRLGVVLMDHEDYARAEAALSRALALSPTAETLNHLGMVLGACGRHAEARWHYQQALELEPGNPVIHSNLLFLLLHTPGRSRQEVFEAHQDFGVVQEARVPALPALPRPPPDAADRRLRVGYVSPDFRDHAVMMYIEPVLRLHDRDRFELFAYHTDRRVDATTARLRTLVEQWRRVAAMPADLAAAQIRADRIDILVDLAGHTRNNGLQIFVRKPAPIQAAWIGYPGTTGLSRIDYRITDPGTDPPGENDPFYTERLARIAAPLVFQPPAEGPPVRPLPLLRQRRPRFGSFNRPQKINPPVIATWSQILLRIPDATLLLVVPGGEQAAVQAATRALFAGHGVGGERLEIVGRRPLNQFLELVAEVDIALDPFPYCGGSTSYLTLWMGVPLIALAGDGASSSLTAQALRAVQLDYLVAADAEDYVRIAVALTQAPENLARLRADLRSRVHRSCIRDEMTLVRALEAEYRRWWTVYLNPDDPAGAKAGCVH